MTQLLAEMDLRAGAFSRTSRVIFYCCMVRGKPTYSKGDARRRCRRSAPKSAGNRYRKLPGFGQSSGRDPPSSPRSLLPHTPTHPHPLQPPETKRSRARDPGNPMAARMIEEQGFQPIGALCRNRRVCVISASTLTPSPANSGHLPWIARPGP